MNGDVSGGYTECLHVQYFPWCFDFQGKEIMDIQLKGSLKKDIRIYPVIHLLHNRWMALVSGFFFNRCLEGFRATKTRL